jgi:glycoprotein endo-alpha-1,2-mannosidase
MREEQANDPRTSCDVLLMRTKIQHTKHRIVRPTSAVKVFISGLLVLTVLLGACDREPAGTGGAAQASRLVLAFYYPWYGRADGPSGKWYHWNPATARHAATDSPVLGLYDSNDTAVVRQHIRWAKDAGIDGFISSWWGPSSFEDRSLRVLLRIAEQENFKITVIVEHPFTVTELRNDLHTLVETHATSPAWMRTAGRPVVFFYARIMNRFSPDQFRQAFEGTGAFTLADSPDSVQAGPFDGVFSYGPVQDVDRYLQQAPALRNVYHADSKIFVAATVPGYDDSVIRQPARLLPRDDAALFRKMWAGAAGADWVTVTSWNEWHEGTEIEPSVEYGDSFLKLTRTLADVWHRAR